MLNCGAPPPPADGIDGVLVLAPPPPPPPPLGSYLADAIFPTAIADDNTAKAKEAIPAGFGAGPIATGEAASDAVTALKPSTMANAN